MSSVINTASPGLANRIKNYVSLMRLYDNVKTNSISDDYLFGGIGLATPEEMNTLPVIGTQDYVDNQRWRLKVYEDDSSYLKDIKVLDCLYKKIPEYFIKVYLPYFENLKVNPDILDYVNQFTDGWEDDVVGLHIRSWYCDRNRFHSNELFEKEIDKLDKDKKIFFCSDNGDVQKYFVEKYSDRILTYERTLYNSGNSAESGHNKDVQSTTDALIEMLILSRCSKFIGTYISSFDEVAWWLSGCKSEVIIPKPNNVPEEFERRFFKLGN
jgi:hypothetical protein